MTRKQQAQQGTSINVGEIYQSGAGNQSIKIDIRTNGSIKVQDITQEWG